MRTARPAWRIGGALVAGLAAGFAGCGGGGSSTGGDEHLECLFVNCKDSTDVAVADISPSFEVTQEGGRVTATSDLGYRFNLISAVRITVTTSRTPPS